MHFLQENLASRRIQCCAHAVCMDE